MVHSQCLAQTEREMEMKELLNDHESRIIKHIIYNEEGGATLHCNDNDAGGVTRFGISERFLKHCGERDPVNKLIDMTYFEAEQIYLTHFIDPLSGVNDAIKDAVASCGVNCGIPTAVRLLQKSINSMSTARSLEYIDVDGMCGPITRHWADFMCGESITEMRRSFVFHWKSHYTDLAVKVPAYGRFIKGWLLRADWYVDNKVQ